MRTLGFTYTDVFDSTDQIEHGVGDYVLSPTGGKAFVFVEAAADLDEGELVRIQTTGYTAAAVNTTSSAPGTGQGKICGLVVATLTNGQFGWVQVLGPGEVQLSVGSSCAAHTELNSTATSGRLDDDATAGAEVINGVVTTGAESSNRADCWLNWPQIGRTL